MQRPIPCAIAVFVLALVSTLTWAGVSEDVRELTGQPTRIIWAARQGQGNFQPGSYYLSKIMGLDTEDGQGNRTILGTAQHYAFMLNFTHDGERFVYNLRGSCSAATTCDATIWVVNFDGSDNTQIKSGAAGYVWYDEAEDQEWVYYRQKWCHCGGEMRRFLLDDPDVDEFVTGRQFGLSRFSVSGDGKYIGGESPQFGSTGIYDIEADSYEEYGKGCWASISPDTDYYLLESVWNPYPLHSALATYKMGNKTPLGVFAPIGFDKSKEHQVQDDRFTNDGRYVVFKAPDVEVQAEVYIAKLKENRSGIEAQVQVTNGPDGSVIPAGWIQPEIQVSARHASHVQPQAAHVRAIEGPRGHAIRVQVADNKPYRLSVYAADGALLARFSGMGTREHALAQTLAGAGMCVAVVETTGATLRTPVVFAK